MAGIQQRHHVLVSRVAVCRDCPWREDSEALAALVRVHVSGNPAHLVDVTQVTRITYEARR